MRHFSPNRPGRARFSPHAKRLAGDPASSHRTFSMKPCFLLPTVLSLAALSARAEPVYTHDFAGNALTWPMADGETMTTGRLAEPFTTDDPALAGLVQKKGAFTDAQSATLMAWVNLPADAPGLPVFKVATRPGGDIGNHYGYSLVMDSDSRAGVFKTAASTGPLAKLRPGKWTHLALAVEKSPGERLASARLYVNGAPWGGTPPPPGTVFGTNLNGDGFRELTFGQPGMSAARLQVYDRTLTDDEIAAVYKRQAAEIPEPATCAFAAAGLAVALLRPRARRAGRIVCADR